MADVQIASYGAWHSPISPELVAAGRVRLDQVLLDGPECYWIETRPGEGGRSVIVRSGSDGQMTDCTPAPFNVRSRVHEYGGGAYTVASGTLFFVHFDDQQVYRQDAGAAPRAITTEPTMRYADLLVDARRGRLIAVREEHRADGAVINTLVSLDWQGAGPTLVLAQGNDFYATPALSPDGGRLAWLTWNQPNMPWDGTELWSATLTADGAVADATQVAGGLNESIFQPSWSPDGTLYFVSDRSGWWNLYRSHKDHNELLAPIEGEIGLPQWVFGLSTYGFVSAELIVCAVHQQGVARLATINTQSGATGWIPQPYSTITSLRTAPGQMVFIGGSPTAPEVIVEVDSLSRQQRVLHHASAFRIDPGYLSIPQPIAFPTEGGLTAYALYYPPRNCCYAAPAGERPPLLVKCHGGPTDAASSAFDLRTQFWTSRGIGVLDVNYGGSSGYGRAYRERLNGRWGIVDVDDCVNGARYLVERGEVDPARLAITGGSAGGYTTLSALTFRDVFKAGASYFGLSDLEALARDTHKFEARYLDRLVGPYPEALAIYRERSPIHAIDRLGCPIILLQGLDDKVVLPNQAEMMLEAMRAKGLPVAYLAFPGEGHGFRRAETIIRALSAELYFYARIFGFTLADPVEPVVIENLEPDSEQHMHEV